MKARWFLPILIFISAYSPLSIIFLIQDYSFKDKAFKHFEVVMSILLVSIISIIILWFSVNKIKVSSETIKILSFSNKSGELLNYSIPYMISFFIMDFSNTNLVLSFVFFMLIMYVLTLKTHNIFINPILAIMGYNIFDVKYVKKNNTHQLYCLVKGEKLMENELCRFINISEHLLLITERNLKV